MNILIKLMSIVSLVIAPYIAVTTSETASSEAAPIVEAAMPVSINKELSSGVTLNFLEGGIEDQVIKFIESDSVAGKDNWFNFKALSFASGSNVIDSTSMNEVKNISKIMEAFPNVNIKVGGYTDNTGDDAANLKLSSERAAAVKAALVATGIADARLEAEGYGETNAVASNDTEEGRSQNRRIAVSVRKK
jgi:K(+)-stimulated pyrophosphate-energized sodium pump